MKTILRSASVLFCILIVTLHGGAVPKELDRTPGRIVLGFLGRYHSGDFDRAGAEIPAYDPASKRLFVVSASLGKVTVLDLANPLSPVKITDIDCAPGSPNSVAVNGGRVAIAVQAPVKTDAGQVLLFPAAGPYAGPTVYPVGALPDMLTFTPDGQRILVANEGEPSDDYSVDPEGSVSIVHLPSGVVSTASFVPWNSKKAQLRASGVRIYGGLVPAATTVAQDLEPESITVSANGQTAWVTLQEANAIAIVNVAAAKVTDIVPLGFKDHALERNALDPSNADGDGVFQTGPIRGMYQPDGIASWQVGPWTFLITANEGDVRAWGAFNEEKQLKNVVLDPGMFPDAAALQAPTAFGNLAITDKHGDVDNDGDFDFVYANGARSFSIWNDRGRLVYDSGDQFERITSAAHPRHFNANHTGNALDNRSDNKGPEPEGVVVAKIDVRTYAFIGLERIGGVMVYDVTNPYRPVFQSYLNTRDFNATPGAAAGPGLPVPGLDLGPEGLVFVPAADSPNGKDLLIVANEVSGSTVIYQVSKILD